MGAGLFDGAYLVQNFENLNPANTFWDKYYNVYRNVDTEVPRFLEFERWWGGFLFDEREEIEWITQNLFVGNKLWRRRDPRRAPARSSTCARSARRSCFSRRWATTSRAAAGVQLGRRCLRFDRRDQGARPGHRRPAAPERGSPRHLRVWRVAKKEHAQIVSVLKSIEALPPGCTAWRSRKWRQRWQTKYEVEFREHRLEEIVERLNRFKRKDEVAFEAVERVSDFNRRRMSCWPPLVQATSNEASAKLMAASCTRCAPSAGRFPTPTLVRVAGSRGRCGARTARSAGEARHCRGRPRRPCPN